MNLTTTAGAAYEWRLPSRQEIERDAILKAADELAGKTIKRLDPLGLAECFSDWNRCEPEAVQAAIVEWLRALAEGRTKAP